MFDRAFFLKHQGKLLWLLNTPVVRLWFRYVLRIHGEGSSVSSGKIWGILPDAIIWREGYKYKAEFRTHAKFSKRLYYVFYPFWLLLGYTKPYNAFSPKFFVRHQETLVWSLNAPVMRWIMRFAFRIHGKGSGVGQRYIVKISTNGIWWRDGERITAEFRTHEKYAKRLYYSFRPLWWICHVWDWAFADRWVPELSFGLYTLTQYPDTGNPGTNSVDGNTYHMLSAGSGVSWATLKAAAGTNVSNGAVHDICYMETDSGSGNWLENDRVHVFFDTSALTSAAVISGAVLSLYGSSKQDTFTVDLNPTVNIYVSTVTSNNTLAAGDYANVADTEQCDAGISYSSFSTVEYNDWTFNTTGRGNISKTGTSKFVTRQNYDISGTPTWEASLRVVMSAYMSDQTGTSNDPKLTITYTTPGSLIAYPDPDSGTTSCDGYTDRMTVDETWSTLRSSTGNNSGFSGEPTHSWVRMDCSTTTNQYQRLRRGYAFFDTSIIAMEDTISAATLSLYGYAKNDAIGCTPTINAYSVSTGSNTTISNSDHDISNHGSTDLSDTAITYSGFSLSGYNSLTLNTSGISNISKAGITKFSIRGNHDVSNTAPTPWSSGTNSSLTPYSADQTGTSNDPKLTVTYTVYSETTPYVIGYVTRTNLFGGATR